MNERSNSALGTSILSFLAGAALGAVVVALTTPRKGADLREDLSDLGSRAKARLKGIAQRGARAVEAAEEAAEPSLGDQAGMAWKDLKRGAARAGKDLKEGLGEVQQDLRS